MKKAKLMLSALGIFAVLGTAYAFSANKFTSHFIYTGTGGVCQTRLDGAGISNGTGTIAASTVSLAANCPTNWTIAITD